MTELIVKKSRFIAYAAFVETEDEAKAHIALVAKEHKRAKPEVTNERQIETNINRNGGRNAIGV